MPLTRPEPPAPSGVVSPWSAQEPMLSGCWKAEGQPDERVIAEQPQGAGPHLDVVMAQFAAGLLSPIRRLSVALTASAVGVPSIG
jgi:hypothetical protein